MSIDLQSILQEILLFLPKIASAMVILVLGILAASAAQAGVHRGLEKRMAHVETARLISRLAKWSIISLSIIAALDQVSFDVTTFLTGLGVAGVTIGFALQDISQNFVSGIILLIRRPFDIGHAVNIAGYSGMVVDVQTRDTTIRTWAGEMVVLPNKQVLGEAITNYSINDNRRRTVRVGLSYDQDLDRAKEILLDTLASVDGVLQDPAPMVHGEEFGDYAVTLAIRFWLNQRTHGLLDVHSDAVFAIQKAAREAKIDIPYPIQVVQAPDGSVLFGE